MISALGPDGLSGRRPGELLVEEPLQIRLDDRVVATTMRTPGHDFELAVGFCHAEGLMRPGLPTECRSAAIAGAIAGAMASAVETSLNVVSVYGGVVAPRTTAPRLGTISSSCGWCGANSIDELVDRLDVVGPVSVPSLATLAEVEAGARRHQRLFAATGAAHAAACFDAATGEVAVVREDIGRHNAVDKVVGRLRLDDELPAAGRGLWVSGRASFEIVQKAWAAGFGLVVSVSAPSALAVSTAGRSGITLVGVARSDGATVYHTQLA